MMFGAGRPTRTDGQGLGVAALVALRLMKDQAPAALCDDLEIHVDACRAGTSTTDTTAAAKKRFVMCRGSEFDRCGEGIGDRMVWIFYEIRMVRGAAERRVNYSCPVFFQQFFARGTIIT